MVEINEIVKRFDDVAIKLSEIRQYNRNTALIVILLWGIGLPLTFVIALNIAIRI